MRTIRMMIRIFPVLLLSARAGAYYVAFRADAPTSLLRNLQAASAAS
jgi:hypothetical protein